MKVVVTRAFRNLSLSRAVPFQVMAPITVPDPGGGRGSRKLAEPSAETIALCSGILNVAAESNEALLAHLRTITEIPKHRKDDRTKKEDLSPFIEVFDAFDKILEKNAGHATDTKYLPTYNPGDCLDLILEVLRVTSLLLDSRNPKNMALYNSIEWLHAMLVSDHLNLASAALEVLLTLGRHRRKVSEDLEQDILTRLTALAQGWGTGELKVDLAMCALGDASTFPQEMSTLYFEFFLSNKMISAMPDDAPKPVAGLRSFTLPGATLAGRSPSDVLHELVDTHEIPRESQFELFARIMLQQSLPELEQRQLCMKIRLISFSILLLRGAPQQVFEMLFEGDPRLIPELVDLLKRGGYTITDGPHLPTFLYIAGFRTLHAFVQAQMRVDVVLEAVEAGVQHGFLPQMLRQCVSALLEPQLPPEWPFELVIAVFTLVQLLCHYPTGVEALTASGTVSVLLPLIKGQASARKFSNRSARMLDMILASSRSSQQVFLDLDAVSVFANRLAAEVTRCLPECRSTAIGTLKCDMNAAQEFLNDIMDQVEAAVDGGPASAETPRKTNDTAEGPEVTLPPLAFDHNPSGPPMCSSDTKSILKSIFKFLLYVVQAPAFATTVRTVVEGKLLPTIETIMRCPTYFGNTSWAYAAKWITDFSNNEPNLISVVQDAGVHTAILDVLDAEVPASSDIIQEIPSLLGAMCLNERGLNLLKERKPLTCLQRIFTSSAHISSLGNDTPGQLGILVDELLRHQPTLRDDGLDAVVATIGALLDFDKRAGEVTVVVGSDHLLRRREKKLAEKEAAASERRARAETTSGDVEMADAASAEVAGDSAQAVVGISITDEAIGLPDAQDAGKAKVERPSLDTDEAPKEELPLYDYIGNVMRFLEAFFSNASNGENAKRFADRDGFAMLLNIYAMECLPREFQQSSAHLAIHNAFRVIVSTGAEPAINLVAEHVASTVDSKEFRASVKEVESGTISDSTIRLVLRFVSYADLLSAAIQDVMQSDEAGSKLLIAFWKTEMGAKCIDLLAQFNALVMEATSLLSEESSAAAVNVPEPTSEPKSKLSRGSRLGRRSRVDTGEGFDGGGPAPTFGGAERPESDVITATIPRAAIEETFFHANSMIQSLFVSILKAANSQKRQVIFSGESANDDGSNIVNSVLRTMIKSVRTTLASSKQGPGVGQSLRACAAKLSNTFGQLDACLLTSSVTRTRNGDQRQTKVAGSVLKFFEEEGGCVALSETLTWLLAQAGDVRMSKPQEKRIPPSNRVLQHLESLWENEGGDPNTSCRCPLKLSDASVVHSNGGGAWVCDVCMGKWEGRFTFACKKCDFDVCPKCYEAVSQSATERAYFRTLKQVLGFAASLLEPSLLSDSKTATPEFMATTKRLRRSCADAVGVVWSPDRIVDLDHENVKAVLRLMANLIVGEHVAPRVNTAPASSEDSFRRILTQSSIGASFGDVLSFGGASDAGRQPHFRPRAVDVSSLFSSSISADAAMAEPDTSTVVADPNSIQMLIDMGFTATQARTALEMTQNNLESAAELILSDGVPDVPEPAEASADANAAEAGGQAPGEQAMSQSDGSGGPAEVASADSPSASADAVESVSETSAERPGSPTEEELLMQAISMSLIEDAGDGSSAALESDSMDVVIPPVTESTPVTSPAPELPASAAVDTEGGSSEAMEVSDDSGAVANLVQALNSAQLDGEGAASQDVMSQMLESLRGSLRDTEMASSTENDNSESQTLKALKSTALDTCLGVLDHDVQLNSAVKDFLTTVMDLEEGTFDNVATRLLEETSEACTSLLREAADSDPQTRLEKIYSAPESLRLHSRLFLTISLLVHGSPTCLEQVSAAGALPLLIELLTMYNTQLKKLMETWESPATLVTPVWLSTLMLYLDQYGLASDSAMIDTALRVESLQRGAGQWEFRKPHEHFGHSGREKWESYSKATSQKIDEAFAANQPHATYDKGGRVQRISFRTMTEVDFELRDSPKVSRYTVRRSVVNGTAREDAVVLPERMVPFTVDELTAITTCCASLLFTRLDQDTMEAVMRVTLRVTKQSGCAAAFSEAGGVRALMGVRHASLFRSTGTLTSLIIRHVVDNGPLLRELMERQIRSKVPSRATSLANALKPLSALYHRDSDAFVAAAQAALKCVDKSGNFDPDGPLKSHYRPVDDMHVAPRDLPKTEPSHSPSPGLSTAFGVLIESLTTRLGTRCGIPEPPEGTEDPAKWDRLHSGDALLHEPYKVLVLMAELVRSYPAGTTVLTTAVVQVDEKPIPFLQYIFDNIIFRDDILSLSPNKGRKVRAEVQSAGRLLTALSDSNNVVARRPIVDALRSVLTKITKTERGELRSAHTIMVGDLVYVLLSKPKSARPTGADKGIALDMMRAGLQNDLVEVVSQLDLNDPDMSSELNTILKPIEVLSRFAKPSALPGVKPSGTSNGSGDSETPARTSLNESPANSDVGGSLDEVPVADAMEFEGPEGMEIFDDQEGRAAIEITLEDDESDGSGARGGVNPMEDLDGHFDDLEDESHDEDDHDDDVVDMEECDDGTQDIDDQDEHDEDLDDEEDDNDEDEDEDEDDDDEGEVEMGLEDREGRLLAHDGDDYEDEEAVADELDPFMNGELEDELDIGQEAWAWGGGSRGDAGLDNADAEWASDPGDVDDEFYDEEPVYDDEEEPASPDAQFGRRHLSSHGVGRHGVGSMQRLYSGVRAAVRSQWNNFGEEGGGRGDWGYHSPYDEYGGGGNPLRALATRLDPASLGEGRGPFYYRMSTSRGDAAEAGGADLHPLLGGGDQRATRDRITLDFSTGARSSGNVIRVPIRDGEGHEAVIERTLQALQIPGMSFSNPSAPEDSGTSAMNHDLRLFSRARTRSQFEYVFGANGPTAAGGSASADDEFLTRMQGEWRLINGTVSPLLTSSISRRVAEPLLEEAKANEAAAKKKADEEAAVAAEKAKKEEQERLQKEKEEADKKKEIDKAAEEAEREVAKAEEGSEPAAQSIASAAPSDSASAENPMSTEVDPVESSAADPAIPQTDDSNMPTLLPGTCGVVEGSSDGTPVSNSALSEAASAPTADVGAVEVPADVDGAVMDAAATGSSEAPGPSSDTAGTTSEAPQAEPEGVSSYEEEFLAAMPDDIRRELEMQQQLAASTAAANVPEEFLNALPPELQREVLENEIRQQQEAEAHVGGVGDGMDPASIIASLAPALRQEVLLENSHDETFLSQLPDAVRAEALALRREREERHLAAAAQREAMQRELDYARQIAARGRLGVARGTGREPNTSIAKVVLAKDGNLVLETPQITQLLRLLFGPHNFQTVFLNRTLGQLCAHSRTRQFVCNALMSVVLSAGPEPTTLSEMEVDGRTLTPRDRLYFEVKGGVLRPRVPILATRRVLEALVGLVDSSPKVEALFTEGRSLRITPAIWDSLCDGVRVSASRKPGVVQLPNLDLIAERGAQTMLGGLLLLAVFPEITGSVAIVELYLDLLSAATKGLPTREKIIEEESADVEGSAAATTDSADAPMEEDPSPTEPIGASTPLDGTDPPAVEPIRSSSAEETTPTRVQQSVVKADKMKRPPLLLSPALLVGVVDMLSHKSCSENKLYLDIMTVLSRLVANRDNLVTVVDALIEMGRAAEKALLKDLADLRAEVSVESNRTADHNLVALERFVAADSPQALLRRVLQGVAYLEAAEKRNRTKAVNAKEASKPPPKKNVATASAPSVKDGEGESTAENRDGTAMPVVSDDAGAPAPDSMDTDQTEAEKVETAAANTVVDRFDKAIALCDERIAIIHQRTEAMEPDLLWNEMGGCLETLSTLDSSQHMLISLAPGIECLLLYQLSLERGVDSDGGRATSGRDSVSALSRSVSSEAAEVEAQSRMDVERISSEKFTGTERRFFDFVDKHRWVLNELVKKEPSSLNSEPFSILLKYPSVLDFRVKERYFRYRLKKLSRSQARQQRIRLNIHREHIFRETFQQLQGYRGSALRGKIDVQFAGEEGIDAGGLVREWYYKLSHEIVNANYALFVQSNIGTETYMPNHLSSINPDHLQYFKFCGRIVAKAIYDEQLLDCHFTRAFYKQILGKRVSWRDMEAVDEAHFKTLMWMTENDITGVLDLTFSVDVFEFGKTKVVDLKPDGRNLDVTEDNKNEYIRLLCEMKLVNAVEEQMQYFLDGFHEVIPKDEIAIFDEQELEMIINGLPDVDIDDLKAHTEYASGYTASSPQIQWFWRAVRTFDRELCVKMIQFITGTGKIPVGGFESLMGMSGPQKMNIHKDRSGVDRLPQAHTCFNQLDLPEYESYEQLRKNLVLAINEGSEGFGFA